MKRSKEALKEYNWPGNIRELGNLVERALILYNGEMIDFQSLLSLQQTMPTISLDNEPRQEQDSLLSLDQAITHHIEKALSASRGKIAGPGGAAEMLAIHPNTLRKKMDNLRINYRRNAQRKPSK